MLEDLTELFVERGVPEHIRSDNGPEFTDVAVRRWLARVDTTTLFIEPGRSLGKRLQRELRRLVAR